MLKEILLSSSILASSLIGGSPVYTNEEMFERINSQIAPDDIWVDVGNWYCSDFFADDNYYDGDNYVVAYIVRYTFQSSDSDLNNKLQFSCLLNVVFNGDEFFYNSCYGDYTLSSLLSQSVEFVNLDNVNLDYDVMIDYLRDTSSLAYSLYIAAEPKFDDDTLESQFLDVGTTSVQGYDAYFGDVISDFYNTFESLLNENYEETQGIFGIIGDSVVAYISSIGAMFTSIMSIFYYEEKLTFIGILLLIGFSIGIVKWAFNLVKRLVRK